MFAVLRNSWPLFLGMMLLMIGNGLQGSLLSIRGAIEGFSPTTMSVVMSAYFLGFLGGSKVAPRMIRRVGHVRVFAALGSLISACMIMFAAAPDPIVWVLMRVLIGFCFSGVYVVAESWLNDTATNETRGQTLGLYVMVQMVGIVLAQGILNLADPGGYILFVIPSVLVSVAFAPMLLAASPAPVFEATRPMSLRQLFITSPLGCVGIFLLGGIFAGLFGMAAVYGTEAGLNVQQISIFFAMIYLGGMVCQYPISWFSDRMDRRILISGLALAGAVSMFIGAFATINFNILLVLAFLAGGISNPLYALLVAYTNDFLEHDEMASAIGGLIFISGIGAISGPIVVGQMMEHLGSSAFFLYIGGLFLIMGAYGVYRMTQRAAPAVEDTQSYEPMLPTGSIVAIEAAQEVANEAALEEAALDEAGDGASS
jgi:MFS family permease